MTKNIQQTVASSLALSALLLSAAAARGQIPTTTNTPSGPASASEVSPTHQSQLPSESVTRLKEVVVTGTRQETAINEVPADVSVITAEELRKPGVSGYQEALREVPGVKINVRQEADMATPGIEIRGLESNPTSGGNVLIMLDGIPQRRLSFGGPYVGGLPYDALTRMELVKGPASSLYGRGAMAGALQLFTSPGTETWQVETWNTYESTINQAKTAWRVSGPLDSKTGATFSLTGSGSYTDGWQPRTDGAQGNGYFHACFPLSEKDTLSVMLGYFNGNRDMAAPVLIDTNGHRLPGIARDENLSVPDQNSLDLAEVRAGLAWERNWTDQLNSKLTLSYWNGDTDWEVGRPDDRPASGTILSRPSSDRPWNENYFFSELQLSQDYAISKDVTGTLIGGGNLEYSTYQNEQQNIWSPGSSSTRGILLNLATMQEPDPSTWIYGPWGKRDTTEWDPGFFVKNRFNFWERVDLDAGARFDWYERHQENLVSGAASTVRGDAISPSVGASLQIVKSDPHLVSAYGSWGKGFSPVYRSVGTTEIVDINPETSQSYEAGLKSSLYHGKIETTVAFYHLERNDVVGSLSSTVTTNIGDWVIEGVELGIRLRPVTGVSVYGNYTYRTPTIAKDISAPQNEGNQIPFVADDMFSLGIEYQHPSGIFAGIDDNYIGPSFADNANTVHLPSYHLLSAFIGYRWKRMEVSVFVHNLLDEEYYSAVFNNVKYGSAFEGMPRSVGVAFAYAF